jgi:hypothetical protein
VDADSEQHGRDSRGEHLGKLLREGSFREASTIDTPEKTCSEKRDRVHRHIQIRREVETSHNCQPAREKHHSIRARHAEAVHLKTRGSMRIGEIEHGASATASAHVQGGTAAGSCERRSIAVRSAGTQRFTNVFGSIRRRGCRERGWSNQEEDKSRWPIRISMLHASDRSCQTILV